MKTLNAIETQSVSGGEITASQVGGMLLGGQIGLEIVRYLGYTNTSATNCIARTLSFAICTFLGYRIARRIE